MSTTKKIKTSAMVVLILMFSSHGYSQIDSAMSKYYGSIAVNTGISIPMKAFASFQSANTPKNYALVGFMTNASLSYPFFKSHWQGNVYYYYGINNFDHSTYLKFFTNQYIQTNDFHYNNYIESIICAGISYSKYIENAVLACKVMVGSLFLYSPEIYYEGTYDFIYKETVDVKAKHIVSPNYTLGLSAEIPIKNKLMFSFNTSIHYSAIQNAIVSIDQYPTSSQTFTAPITIFLFDITIGVSYRITK